MLNKNDIRRPYSEDQLRAMAESISATITIRTDDNGCSGNVTRKTSPAEKKKLFAIAYGALLGLDYGESTRSDRASEQAICDTVEFIFDLAFPQANGYDSIYCPLKEALNGWGTEPNAAR